MIRTVCAAKARVAQSAWLVCAAMALICSGGCANDVDEPVEAVATTGMIADTVRAVADDGAKVHALMGPGVDPHMYRPTRRDMQRMLSAEVVFANGHELEGKMSGTFRDVQQADRRVVFVAEMLDPDRLLRSEEYEGAFDPHVWMDPGRWADIAHIIAETLAEIDPENAGRYASNAASYAERLDALDAYTREVVATIPEHRRVLITAHDAFHYFGDAYGIEVLGIQGISTDSEAGLRRIEMLVDRLVEDEIPVVFTESSVADKHVRALIDGAQARGHEVRIGGELYSDAMGPGGTYEGTYIGMIDHNVTTIVRGLGGDAPAGGMNGRLGPER